MLAVRYGRPAGQLSELWYHKSVYDLGPMAASPTVVVRAAGLRAKRHELGLTYAQVALLADIPADSIWEIDDGVKAPAHEERTALMRARDADFEELFTVSAVDWGGRGGYQAAASACWDRSVRASGLPPNGASPDRRRTGPRSGSRQGLGPQDFQDALAVRKPNTRELARLRKGAAKGSWNP